MLEGLAGTRGIFVREATGLAGRWRPNPLHPAATSARRWRGNEELGGILHSRPARQHVHGGPQFDQDVAAANGPLLRSRITGQNTATALGPGICYKARPREATPFGADRQLSRPAAPSDSPHQQHHHQPVRHRPVRQADWYSSAFHRRGRHVPSASSSPRTSIAVPFPAARASSPRSAPPGDGRAPFHGHRNLFVGQRRMHHGPPASAKPPIAKVRRRRRPQPAVQDHQPAPPPQIRPGDQEAVRQTPQRLQDVVVDPAPAARSRSGYALDGDMTMSAASARAASPSATSRGSASVGVGVEWNDLRRDLPGRRTPGWGKHGPLPAATRNNQR